MMALYLGCEVLLVVYYRTLAEFDHVKSGVSPQFAGNFGLFWGVIALVLIVYFLATAIKFYLLSTSILKSTTSLHYRMLEAIARAPISFFEQTPSGTLTNKFSNDIGVLDSSIVYTAKDMLAVPVVLLVAFFNLSQINMGILVPGAVIVALMILFFRYGRSVILACKQLELQSKSPIFNFLS